jgi:cytoskeletal protein CcmA (bactofilin family)
MPFCSKCGAQVNEDIAFCPTCGTPIRQPATKMEGSRLERGARRPLSTLAIVLIVLLVSTSIIVAITFIPLRGVDVTASRSVPYQTGVDTINLDFSADVARINVAFEDLEDNLVTLQLSILGNVGAFTPSSLYDLSFEKTVVDNVLTVTSELDVADLVWPLSFTNLNVTCDLRIDYALNASLNIKTSVGGIVVDTRSGTFLDDTSLETTTGSVEATLAVGVILSGDVSLMSTTGGVKLNWNNAIATKDLQVDVTTTTGGVDVDIEQDARLQHDVTLNAAALTGGVDFTIDLQGAVGANIESAVTTGGITIDRQIGFSGTNAHLQSDNYPADSNFEAQLQTTTGGINIDAKHTS